VSGSNFSGILGVVVEVVGGHHAILVTDEPIRAHLGQVELDLDFYVLGDREQRAGQLLDENFAGFALAVDVPVMPVAFVIQFAQEGQCLEQ